MLFVFREIVQIWLKILFVGDLRVCTYCCKVVLSYLQSADIGADLSADLRALQEDLQTKFGNTFVKNADGFQTGNVSSSDISEKGEASSSIRRKQSVGNYFGSLACELVDLDS